MKCGNCGAALSSEQLRGGDCPFCGAALRHAAQAIEQAASVREMLLDSDGDGVPDMLQGTHLDPNNRTEDPRSTDSSLESPQPRSGAARKLVFLVALLPLLLGLLPLLYQWLSTADPGGLVTGVVGPASLRSVCLLDANGDGIGDIATLGGASGNEERPLLVDGSTGKVIWRGEAQPRRSPVHCLSDDWFVVARDDFQLHFHQARSPEVPTRILASDKLSYWAMGDGCVAIKTADKKKAGFALPSGMPTNCEAGNWTRTTDGPENVMQLTESSAVARRGERTYQLEARKSGTKMLSIGVHEGSKALWERELPYVKPTFSSAIEGANGIVVTWGHAPGKEKPVYLVALDGQTGEQLYQVAYTGIGPNKVDLFSWNGEHVLIFWFGGLRAVDIATGQERWSIGR